MSSQIIDRTDTLPRKFVPGQPRRLAHTSWCLSRRDCAGTFWEAYETGFILQVTIPFSRSMLDFEETLQQRLNEAGALATQEGLRQFYTDGSPIAVVATKFIRRKRRPG